MGTRAKAAFAVVMFASVAHADPSKPAKGFWKVLVTPNAKWTLQPHGEDDTTPPAETITIETYDVRKIGDADVARLRWTAVDGKESRTYNDGADDLLTQVAVTDKGMYMLRAEMDDAAVTAALAKAPSRSDPPKPYKGTKLNTGRHLRIAELGIVCMGWESMDGSCDERCTNEMCIDANDGIISLDGTYVPQDSFYVSKRYEADYSGATTLHFRKRRKR